MARTDAHRPSAIIPTDYTFVEFEYLGEDDCPAATLARREHIRAHMKNTGGTYSHHQHGGNCHICGAACVYTALFYHKPTNTYIRTGLDCTDKLDASVDGSEFRKVVRAALESVAGKRKAQALLEKNGMAVAWGFYNEDWSSKNGWEWINSHREESIVRDMVGKLVRYGSLSDAQMAFMRRLLDAIANRATILAQRAAESAAAAPVPVTDQRIVIEGEILSIRPAPKDMPMASPRMLVKHADGWKVWGTLPRSLDAGKGDRVRFAAKIKRSDKDEKFGFFSRPTKAEKVA